MRLTRKRGICLPHLIIQKQYKVLAERVRYFKEDAEGVAAMCKAMEDMRNEAVMDERKDVACRLLKMGGMTLDKIAEISKLSIEEVRMLASQKNA